MEERIRHLEQDVAVIKSTMATSSELNGLRAELHQSMNNQTWKIVAAIVSMTAIFSVIVTLLKVFA